MSSTGAGYDLSPTTYSPDGRIFQVEYASKAVENSGTAVGVRCKDGIILGVEKLLISKMLKPGSNRRIHKVDLHIGIAMTGYNADGRSLVNKALEECQTYKSQFGVAIPPTILADRIASFMHLFTTYWALRPFGITCIISGYDEQTDEFELFMVEPSGLVFKYYGCSAGKGRRACNTAIERTKFADMTCEEALKDVAKLLEKSHDEVKDKPFELEMACISTGNSNMLQTISHEVMGEVQAQAKAEIEKEEDAEGDD